MTNSFNLDIPILECIQSKNIKELKYFIKEYPHAEFYILHSDDTEGQTQIKDLLDYFDFWYKYDCIPAIQIADLFPQLNNDDWNSIDTVKNFITAFNKGEMKHD